MTQVREEVTFTDGRVIVRGNRLRVGPRSGPTTCCTTSPTFRWPSSRRRTTRTASGDGMQQALAYSHPDCLDVPFAISSNGDGFLIHDRTGTFPTKPSSKSVSMRFRRPTTSGSGTGNGVDLAVDADPIVTQDFHDDGSGKSPRYYQLNAINRTIEAIAQGQDRILLVMATGTGKTYTAFQIIWRLWKSGAKKRILFLADRNILVDQTKTNDFKPFGGR